MAYADTQSSLLIRIRDSADDASWTLFVDVYTPIVFRYLRTRGLQDADAADVTQDVLLEVAKSIRQFEYQPEKGRFRDWLALVTRRRLAKHWQRSQTAARVANAAEYAAAGQDNQMVDAEWLEAYQGELLRIALRRIESSFESTTWQAFIRTWLDGTSAAAVSQQLGMTIDLVYSAKSRVLKRLEAEVRMLGDDCVWINSSR